MRSRWIVDAEPRIVRWVSTCGHFVTFDDAPRETCNVRDYKEIP